MPGAYPVRLSSSREARARCPLNASRFPENVKPEDGTQRTIDLRPFKEKLRAKLPDNSPLVSDLLLEPDAMPVDKAAVLIPHYLRRLERELETYQVTGPGVLARP